MAQIPVTAVVITLNEAAGIKKTLDMLAPFDQVLVVDSNSNDGTQDIAKAAGVEVVNFDWNGLYPKKKQWSLEIGHIQNDWVLLLDGDEAPNRELVNEIAELFHSGASPTFAAFDVGLDYRFAGKVLRHGHQVSKRSLLNKTLCRFPDVGDHMLPGIREVEGHYQPLVVGRVGTLEGRILHDDVDPVSTWFARHNNYSDWEAHVTHAGLRERTDSSRNKKGRLFHRLPLKPIVFFVYSFFLKQGFRDGRAGFDFALGLAFYYWQIGVKSRELARNSPS